MLHKSLAILLITLSLLPVRLSAQAEYDEDFEDIYVFLRIERIGGYEISAIYSYETEQLYLPVMELFRVLQINFEATAYNDVVSGFFLDEDLRYRIDYPAREILFGDQRIPLSDEDILQTLSGLFLAVDVFGPVFGLDCQFNFRSLSVVLRTDLELPAIREMRLKQMRQNVERLRGITEADTTLYRRYHVARMGMIDWSLFSTQFDGIEDDTRLSVGLGTEFLGGETNLFLNLSSRDGFDERRQQYQWRWVNNDTRLVKQIRAGKISSSAIASVFAPMLGASVTNTPSTYRRSFGEYTLAEFTEPGWTVELYVNSVLIDFVTADASGFFQFDVPMVYGTTQVMLKFYGPYGEERTREQYLNIPYNFIPQGEFEYTLTGGMVQDRDNTLFGRAQAYYGLARSFTIGAGFEYLSNESSILSATPSDGEEVVSSPPLEIPFLSAAANLFGRLMISGEYAHGVRTRALLSYRLPSNMVFDLDYAIYDEAQRAIRFTYLEERRAGLSVPWKIGQLRGITRMGFRQNVYEFFTYNTGDILLSTSVGRVSATLSGFATWIDQRTPYISSTVAMGIRLPYNFILRPQAQFDVSAGSMVSMKVDMEKRIGRVGWLSAGYEENVRMNLRSVNVNFRYDLPFAQISAASRINRETLATSQGVRGSMALGSGSNHVHTDNRSMVGRGGITIMPFVDVNHNGQRDPGEPLATGLNVRLSGGRTLPPTNDSLIRIIDLEPYTSYLLQLDENSLENIAWRLRHKTKNVYVDPNQFKQLEIPVLPMGEVSGTVYLETAGRQRTIGRVLMNIFHDDGQLFTQVMTEPDGYYINMQLPPGQYYVAPDFSQLQRMNVTAEQERIDFEVLPDAWGDIVYGLDLVLIAEPTETPDVQVTEPESQPIAVTEPEPQPEPIAVTEPSPVPATEIQPEPVPQEPEPITVTEPEPEPEPEPITVTEPEPQQEPIAVTEPEPKPQPKPITVTEAETEPEPEPITVTEPEPEPEPALQPQPQPQPDLAAMQAQEIDAFTRMLEQRLDEALRLFIQAQQAVVAANLNLGMQLVNQSLSLYVTGQALALKGTIYYLTGQFEHARTHWQQAKELIPDLEIPDIPENQRSIHRE